MSVVNVLQLKAALEATPGVGTVHVTYAANDPRQCSGGVWRIYYESQPGDIALMTVVQQNLTGTGVHVTVEEVNIPTCSIFVLCLGCLAVFPSLILLCLSVLYLLHITSLYHLVPASLALSLNLASYLLCFCTSFQKLEREPLQNFWQSLSSCRITSQRLVTL